MLDRGASLVRSFVRQHGLADYVTDRVNRGIVSLQVLIDLNKSPLANSNLRTIESWNLGIWFPSNRDQDFVEYLLAILYVFTLEANANSVGFFFHRGHSSVE